MSLCYSICTMGLDSMNIYFHKKMKGSKRFVFQRREKKKGLLHRSLIYGFHFQFLYLACLIKVKMNSLIFKFKSTMSFFIKVRKLFTVSSSSFSFINIISFDRKTPSK